MSKPLHDTLHKVTQRVIERSKPARSAYLDLIRREGENMGERNAVSCSNLAHAYAGALEDQAALVAAAARGPLPECGPVKKIERWTALLLIARMPHGRCGTHDHPS